MPSRRPTFSEQFFASVAALDLLLSAKVAIDGLYLLLSDRLPK